MVAYRRAPDLATRALGPRVATLSETDAATHRGRRDAQKTRERSGGRSRPCTDIRRTEVPSRLRSFHMKFDEPSGKCSIAGKRNHGARE
jgi:hypothetical protein